ncbi:MAG TPA: adenylate/guanylate cyclase domain-containing protein [Candidatus Hydrogenedentes bacterium]|nr:adenylate/guanylate cyclase domain-containing protein [Candidatus Hydrogenedentota bacterium]
MPQVIIEQPGVPPMTVPLAGDEISFGRSEESDVVLVADEVSRHHAKICRRGDRMVLLDLKSLNGTYVNRQRVVERLLTHMDEVWFGSKCRLVYRDDTQAGRAKAASSTMTESKLLQSMSRISAEMDRVGNNMTMIGKQSVRGMEAHKTPMPLSTPDDVMQMGRAYRRMAALWEASQVMTKNFDLHKRLGEVLDIVIHTLAAERGFVMLREEGANSLTVKVAREMGQDLQASSPSMGIAGRAAIDGEPVLMSDRMSDQEFGARESIILGQIYSAMCVPLKIKDRILGSIYIDTRKPGVTFTEDDLELFNALAYQSAMAIDNVQLHSQVVEAEKKRQNLGRFLSKDIVEKIMNDDTALELGGQKTQVTTMFCDVRGSSKIAERISPQQLVELLNEHFTAMTDIIFKYGGTLDKYIGDEIMAVFGAPISYGDEEYQAVCAALEIVKRNAELNQTRVREGRPEIHLGIGIETGEVIAGYVGSPMRMEFTVVGDRVNTAKRFCDMATAGTIVTGHETWEGIKDRVNGTPIGTVMLKGKEQAVHAYKILSLKAGKR